MPINHFLKFSYHRCDFCSKELLKPPYEMEKNWRVYQLIKNIDILICPDCLLAKCIECGGLIAFKYSILIKTVSNRIRILYACNRCGLNYTRKNGIFTNPNGEKVYTPIQKEDACR